MHSRRGHDPLRRGLPGHRRSPARSGTCAGSAMLADYETTGELPPLPGVRPRRRRRGRCLRGTPSTGSPPTLTRAFGGRPVRGRAARRAGSPTGAALLDGSVLEGAEACGQAPVRRVRRRPVRARPPRADTASSTCTTGAGGPPPVGQVRLRLVGRRARRRTPTCAAPPPATWSPREQRDAVVGRLGPGPAARRTPTRSRAWARIRRSRAPIGGLLMDQAVLAGVGNVYRAEVLFRHRIHPLRPGQHAAARPVRRRCGTTWSS